MKAMWLAAILVVVMMKTAHGDGGLPIQNPLPCIGVVVPNTFEMNPLFSSPAYKPNRLLPHVDFAGRRFHMGTLNHTSVVVVMTGLGMLNAGIATQLLLALFNVKGVVHYGIAGNGNPDLEIGDVTIPKSWAHVGLWNWQRYGDGVNDELALEANGDYTRKIGYLQFSDYSFNVSSPHNSLNRVWYQPEEVFYIDGTPKVRNHTFFFDVDSKYLKLARQLEGLELERCVNATTCLPRPPKVVVVDKGISASVFVDNAAYRKFMWSKFNVTAIDMESAAVGLVCLQQRKPFIAIRSLSDLAGGGSALSNEAGLYASLAAQNAVIVAIKIVHLVG